MNKKWSITIGVFLVAIALGTADAVVLEGAPTYKAKLADANTNDPEPIIDTSDPEPTKTPPPEGGVRKNDGPNVLKSLGLRNFTVQETSEKVILNSVVTGDTVESRALLLNGDRAGSIAWVSSPNVKNHYIVLKEALHTAFTPEVQDLLDETQRRENRPTRNLLTFYDPGLLPERVVFVRVRERLYEFHIAEGSSEEIFNLIEDLTK